MSTARMAVQINLVMVALRCSRRMAVVRHLLHYEFSRLPHLAMVTSSLVRLTIFTLHHLLLPRSIGGYMPGNSRCLRPSIRN